MPFGHPHVPVSHFCAQGGSAPHQEPLPQIPGRGGQQAQPIYPFSTSLHQYEIQSHPLLFVLPRPSFVFDATQFNRSMKHVQVKRDTISNVITLYHDVQLALIVATGLSNVVPKLKEITPDFNFASTLLPHSGSAAYPLALHHFCHM